VGVGVEDAVRVVDRQCHGEPQDDGPPQQHLTHSHQAAQGATPSHLDTS
jgi:hypothetical protein